MRAIESIDRHGNITRYSSIAAAERAGYCRIRIHEVLRGKSVTHYRMRWRYADETVPAAPTNDGAVIIVGHWTLQDCA
jgi:hypothetical protein